MMILWAAFICLCASATGNEIIYQTSFIEGPFEKKILGRDYISHGAKTNQLAGTIFCVSSSGNGLGKCTDPTYKDHRVILQLDAYNYEIPAHRTPQRLQWRPVANYDQTLAFAVVIAPARCSVHSPSLPGKQHYNMRCPQPENKKAGLRIYRHVKPQIPNSQSQPKLIIPVYEMKDETSGDPPISRVYLFVNPVGMDFALRRSTGDGTLELAPFVGDTSHGLRMKRTIQFGVDDRRLPVATFSILNNPMCRVSFVSGESYEVKHGLFGGINFLCYTALKFRTSMYCTREHDSGTTVRATARDGVERMKIRPYQAKDVQSFEPGIFIVEVNSRSSESYDATFYDP